MKLIAKIVSFFFINKKKIGNIIAVILILSVTVLSWINLDRKKQELKISNLEITRLQVENDSLKNYIRKLEKMEAVSLTVNYTVQNKAVMGKVQTGDMNMFVEAIQTVTKKEALELLKKN